MKTLSIRQPWASLIVTGIKDIENRTWKTSYRGTLLIHSALKSQGKMKEILSSDQYSKVVESGWKPNTNKPLGAIIGKVDLVDCVINHDSIWAEKCMPEHYKIYNWVLANPVLFDEPILNVKGKLSLWEYELPNINTLIATPTDFGCIVEGGAK